MGRTKKDLTPCEEKALAKTGKKTKGKPHYFGRAEDRTKK